MKTSINDNVIDIKTVNSERIRSMVTSKNSDMNENKMIQKKMKKHVVCLHRFTVWGRFIIIPFYFFFGDVVINCKHVQM
jgi:hypothetical protein